MRLSSLPETPMSRTPRSELGLPRRLWPLALAAGLLFALAPAAGRAQAPDPHTVTPGHTLRGLPKQYLAGPLPWPGIPRLNTPGAEHPRWISPVGGLRP